MHSGLLLALFAGVSFASEVKVLTEDNFDETISGNTNVLVEFYAPWCGHCKQLAPEYDAASIKLKDEDVVIAKVDATEESAIAGKFEVRGYPTLIFFKNGKKKEYDGGRTADTIVSWIMKKIGPVLTTLDSAEAVESFKAKADCVVISSVAEGDVDTLKAVAEDLDEPFGIITDSAVAEAAGVSGVVVFKNFDDGKVAYDGAMETEALKTFVSGESIPLVMTWSGNQDKMAKLQAPLFFAGHDGSDVEALTKQLKESVAPFKGKFVFYTVDVKKEENGRLLEFFGLTGDDVVVFSQEARKKYFMDVEMSEIGTWLQKVIDGTAEPRYKSEEIPENNDGPVTVLVGKNFESIVKDSGKDVLVEFYAPWCGHCKKLAPIYDKLGEHFAGDDTVVIAKMDATANEVPEPEVSGFPTLYFFPADNKAGVKYEDGRELEDFIKYIEENAKAPKAGGDAEAAPEATEGHDEL